LNDLNVLNPVVPSSAHLLPDLILALSVLGNLPRLMQLADGFAYGAKGFPREARQEVGEKQMLFG
jgi:hypothetical protein